jgi:hypothetical protein
MPKSTPDNPRLRFVRMENALKVADYFLTATAMTLTIVGALNQSALVFIPSALITTEQTVRQTASIASTRRWVPFAGKPGEDDEGY